LDGDSHIDFDTGEIVSGAPSPVLVHDVLTNLGVNHCIYSSHSNAENLHKYRVVIPCQYSREQLPALLGYLFDSLHVNAVMLCPVPENRTWSQAWYFPRTPQDRAHLFEFWQFSKGSSLDVEKIHEDWLIKSPAPMPVLRESPKKQAHVSADKPGQIDPILLFNDHFKNPFNYLATQGYAVKGDRLLRPNSSTKTPSVQFCDSCNDGKPRVFSHGGDVLNNGYAHDSFDCFMLLEHGGNVVSALKAVGSSFIVNGKTLAKHNQKMLAKASKTNKAAR
jgi:hypothetical protein